MDLFTLMATLGLDTTEFESGIAKSTSKGKSFVSSVSAGTIAIGNLIAKGVEYTAKAATGLAKAGLLYNSQMQDYTSNFKVLLGDYDAAVAQVEDIREMAAKTPFGMEELASGAKTLLSFGVEADNVMDIMSMLGDVSLGNKERFNSLSLVFGQISSTGKLMGQDLLQLINNGFNPLQVIADVTGASMGDLKKVMSGEKTSKEFQKAMKDAAKAVDKLGDEATPAQKMLAQIYKDGAIGADLVTEAFEIATSEGGQFYKGMEEASKTLSGMWSTLKDDSNMLLGMFFQPVSDFLTNSLVPAAMEATSTLSEAFTRDGFIGVLQELPNLTEAATGMISQLITGLTNPERLSAATSALSEALMGILAALTEPSFMSTIFQAGVDILVGLASGMSDAQTVSTLLATISGISTAFWTTITSAENLAAIVAAGGQLVSEIITGIIDALPTLIENSGTIITSILSGIAALIPSIVAAGGGIVDSLFSGISSKTTELVESIKGWWNSVINAVGDLVLDARVALGITSTGDKSNPNNPYGDNYHGTGAPRGGHAKGLFYVPENDFITRLHRGEAVLNAREAEKWRAEQAGSSGRESKGIRDVIVNIDAVPQTPSEIAFETANALRMLRFNV